MVLQQTEGRADMRLLSLPLSGLHNCITMTLITKYIFGKYTFI